MTEPVNLRLARKRRDRTAKEQAAEENRIRFGQTGAEKERARIEGERATRSFDGHRRGPAPAREG